MEDYKKDLGGSVVIFNGRNANGLQWIEAFEHAASFRKLTDEDKKLALPTRLSDGARAWWDLIKSVDPDKTWEGIKASFLEYFGADAHPEVAYRALTFMVQGPNFHSHR